MDYKEQYSEINQIIDSINIAVLTMELDGTVTFANAKMRDILDAYPKSSGKKCYEACRYIWSENGKNFCACCGIDEVVKTGESTEKIVKGHDGQQWLFTWAPIWDGNHKITKVTKTITNITAQIQEKNYLETLLMEIISAMPIGVMIFNGQGQILFLNNAMEKRWGLKYEEVAMSNVHELEVYDSNDLTDFIHQIQKGKRVERLELEVERHDGRKYWVSTYLVPLKKEGDLWQGILLEEDISKLSTEKKQVERNLKERELMLVEQDKLAAVGQLAAGIAHELNTPTTYVRGNMQTFDKYTKIMEKLLSTFKKDVSEQERDVALEKMAKIIDNMKEIANSSFEGTSRLMNIISSMKTFVRVNKDETGEFNIYEPIKDSLVLVYNRLKHVGLATINGKNFKPGEDIDRNTPPVQIKGSAMRLSQLFIILLNNAIDAWQESNEKSIDNSPLQISITVDGDIGSLNLRICDNSGGIPKVVLAKIFEPFYTTKSTKAGTGLGLSIAKQIAAEHNGTLSVENTPGVGVCFVFCIRQGTG